MAFVGLHTRVLFHIEHFQYVLSGNEQGSVNVIDRYLMNTSSHVDGLFEFPVGFLANRTFEEIDRRATAITHRRTSPFSRPVIH
jgi:hypothetical protein